MVRRMLNSATQSTSVHFFIIFYFISFISYLFSSQFILLLI